jgi:hypothetical protein
MGLARRDLIGEIAHFVRFCRNLCRLSIDLNSGIFDNLTRLFLFFIEVVKRKRCVVPIYRRPA